MFNFRRNNQSLLGLEISSSAIKIVEFSGSLPHVKLEHIAIEYLPPNAVVEGNITDIDAVGDAISRAISRTGTSTKNVSCALPSSKAITKTISLPSEINESDLAGQVELEMVQHIPYSIDEISLDFQRASENIEKNQSQTINVVASKTENVEMFVAALEKGGLNPKIMDLELYAFENAILLASKIRKDNSFSGTFGLLDIGLNTTKLMIFDNVSIIYSREQSFGSKQLLNDIQRNYGNSYEEANLILTKGDLPSEAQTKIVTPFCGSACQEVTRALQLFYSSNNAMNIDKLLLLGGCSKLSPLAEQLSQSLKIDVKRPDLFESFKKEPAISEKLLESQSSSLTTALGLAARGILV